MDPNTATDQGLPEFIQQFSPRVLLEFVVAQNVSGRQLFGGRTLESVLSEMLGQPQCLGKRNDVDDRGHAGLEFGRRLAQMTQPGETSLAAPPPVWKGVPLGNALLSTANVRTPSDSPMAWLDRL